MTFEQLWYASYDGEGNPPRCARYSRLAMSQQFDLVIDLALSFAEGKAGYRQCFSPRFEERYWFWPNSASETGWWMVPPRIDKRIFAIHDAAIHCLSLKSLRGSASPGQIAEVLREWKKTRAWRRHVSKIIPRTSAAEPLTIAQVNYRLKKRSLTDEELFLLLRRREVLQIKVRAQKKEKREIKDNAAD